MDYDRLDEVAADAAQGDDRRVGVLSTGERLYVALAANRCDLLGSDSIAYALSRLDTEDIQALIARHRSDVSVRNPRLVEDLSMLVIRLVCALKKIEPDNKLTHQAANYLERQGLQGSPLRGR